MKRCRLQWTYQNLDRYSIPGARSYRQFACSERAFRNQTSFSRSPGCVSNGLIRSGHLVACRSDSVVRVEIRTKCPAMWFLDIFGLTWRWSIKMDIRYVSLLCQRIWSISFWEILILVVFVLLQWGENSAHYTLQSTPGWFKSNLPRVFKIRFASSR
jgi:hypothetical protein